MDLEQETAGFKVLLFTIVAFLASTYFAYAELKYYVRGKTADARIKQTAKTTSQGRRPQPMLNIKYYFRDDTGQMRWEQDTVDADWPLPDNGAIKVQYIPGKPDSSRLLGHRNIVAVIVFFATLVAVGIFGIRLWLEIREAYRPGPPAGMRRRK